MAVQERTTKAQLKTMTGKETLDKSGRLFLGKEASRIIGGGACTRLGSFRKSSAAEKQLVARLLERAGNSGRVKLLDSA